MFFQENLPFLPLAMGKDRGQNDGFEYWSEPFGHNGEKTCSH